MFIGCSNHDTNTLFFNYHSNQYLIQTGVSNISMYTVKNIPRLCLHIMCDRGWYMQASVCMFVVHVHVYVCVCACMRVCVCVHTYVHVHACGGEGLKHM